MCVVYLAWQAHPRYRLILAGNRDEFRARPTAALDHWQEHPDVIGGRDLKEGGSWLAATAAGRFAAVTNFRESPPSTGRRSRGALVGNFVAGDETPATFVTARGQDGNDYGACNLFAGDADALWYWSNRGAGTRALAPGLYGLSNGALDDDWPKMRRGRAALARLVGEQEPDRDELFAMLADPTPADDHELPDTGVGRPLEKMLSSIFIPGRDYGTRASTLLLITHDGSVLMHERRYGADGAWEGETELKL